MKLNNSKTALILLVLIAFNIIISDCEQIKINKIKSRKIRSAYERSKLTRSHSNSKNEILDLILTKIKQIFLTPKNILYFVLGVASEFSSEAETIYKYIEPIIKALTPCYHIMEKAYHKITEEKVSDAKLEEEHLESISMFEKMLDKEGNKKEFCEKTKKEIKYYYKMSYDEREKKLHGSFYELLKVLTPDLVQMGAFEINRSLIKEELMCLITIDSQESPKTLETLKSVYSNIPEYYKQCVYFSKVDCDVFDPAASSVWGFVKTAYSYYKLLNTTKECFHNLVQGLLGPQDFLELPILSELFDSGKNLIFSGLKTALGTVANVLTLGAWGGIKGGYYLIELGMEIKKFYDSFTGSSGEDIAYTFGKLAGKAIKMAKSFLFGRKKLYRKFK